MSVISTAARVTGLECFGERFAVRIRADKRVVPVEKREPLLSSSPSTSTYAVPSCAGRHTVRLRGPGYGLTGVDSRGRLRRPFSVQETRSEQNQIDAALVRERYIYASCSHRDLLKDMTRQQFACIAPPSTSISTSMPCEVVREYWPKSGAGSERALRCAERCSCRRSDSA